MGLAPPGVRAAVLVGLVVLATLAACDESASRPQAWARPTASATRESDGGESAATDPPALAGDLKGDIEGFTTVDACIAAHAGVDPLVGDTLEGIGYDTLLRDACRALEAAKTRSTKPCDEIAASSLRARCVSRVAAIERDPEACPWEVPTQPERGRDPVCLALATSDPRPCAAAFEAVDRATCEAISSGDAARCARLPGRSDRARCERDAKRWAGALPAAPGSSRSNAAALGKATLTEPGDAGVQSFPVDVSRGLVVVERMDGAHVVVGPPLEVGSDFVVSSPNSPGSLSLELVIPSDSRKARVEGGVVRRPNRPSISFDRPQASALAIQVRRFERTRGGAVEVTVSGILREGVGVEVALSTFVRDVVKGAAVLGPARPGLGDGGWMR